MIWDCRVELHIFMVTHSRLRCFNVRETVRSRLFSSLYKYPGPAYDFTLLKKLSF